MVHKVVVDHAAMATGRVVIVVRASLIAMTAARAAMTVTARAVIVARASLIAMTAARAAMTVTGRVVRESSMVIVRVVIVVRASLIVMTAAHAAMTVTARVVRASSMVTARGVIVVRASLIAMTAARAAMTTALAVRVDSIAVIKTNLSVRRRRPIFVAPRSFTARVAASTAKTTRSSHVARMTTAKSLTRAQCAHRVSVIRVAMSDAQPTSALAISVP